MSKAPAATPPRRTLPKIFRRQNSFAGFPTATLSIFNNNSNNSSNSNAPISISSSNRQASSTISSGTTVVSAPITRTTPSLIFHSNTNTTTSSQTKPQNISTSSQFYSLPRHAKAPSNPSLMRTSTSGLGLYLISRNATNSAKKISAAEQLGVKHPPGGRFNSLPRLGSQRKHSNELSTSKTTGYLSLPRPSSKGPGRPVLSLPPTNLNLSLYTDEITLKGKSDTFSDEHGQSKLSKYESSQKRYQTPSRKANFDMKIQPIPKRTSKEMECHHHSSSKKHLKEDYQALPSRTYREPDLIYQSLPRRPLKESNILHQSPPKRPPRHADPHFQEVPARPPKNFIQQLPESYYQTVPPRCPKAVIPEPIAHYAPNMDISQQISGKVVHQHQHHHHHHHQQYSHPHHGYSERKQNMSRSNEIPYQPLYDKSPKKIDPYYQIPRCRAHEKPQPQDITLYNVISIKNDPPPIYQEFPELIPGGGFSRSQVNRNANYINIPAPEKPPRLNDQAIYSNHDSLIYSTEQSHPDNLHKPKLECSLHHQHKSTHHPKDLYQPVPKKIIPKESIYQTSQKKLGPSEILYQPMPIKPIVSETLYQSVPIKNIPNETLYQTMPKKEIPDEFVFPVIDKVQDPPVYQPISEASSVDDDPLYSTIPENRMKPQDKPQTSIPPEFEDDSDPLYQSIITTTKNEERKENLYKVTVARTPGSSDPLYQTINMNSPENANESSDSIYQSLSSPSNRGYHTMPSVQHRESKGSFDPLYQSIEPPDIQGSREGSSDPLYQSIQPVNVKPSGGSIDPLYQAISSPPNRANKSSADPLYEPIKSSRGNKGGSDPLYQSIQTDSPRSSKGSPDPLYQSIQKSSPKGSKGSADPLYQSIQSPVSSKGSPDPLYQTISTHKNHRARSESLYQSIEKSNRGAKRNSDTHSQNTSNITVSSAVKTSKGSSDPFYQKLTLNRQTNGNADPLYQSIQDTHNDIDPLYQCIGEKSPEDIDPLYQTIPDNMLQKSVVSSPAPIINTIKHGDAIYSTVVKKSTKTEEPKYSTVLKKSERNALQNFHSLPRKSLKHGELIFQLSPKKNSKNGELTFTSPSKKNRESSKTNSLKLVNSDGLYQSVSKKTPKTEHSDLYSSKNRTKEEERYQVPKRHKDIDIKNKRPQKSSNSDYQISSRKSPKSEDSSRRLVRSTEFFDYQCITHRPAPKENDSKSQSLPKKKHRDKDQEIKKVNKENDNKSQTLPKRNIKPTDNKHHSTRRSLRDNDGKSRREGRLSPGGPKGIHPPPLEFGTLPPHMLPPPPSPRWMTSFDSDEDDGSYAALKKREAKTNQDSPDITYTRPLPPLPAPSRYRRRTADDQPPPIPPPRITTGPIGSHNPLIRGSSASNESQDPNELPPSLGGRPSLAACKLLSYPSDSNSPSPEPPKSRQYVNRPANPQWGPPLEELYSALVKSTPVTSAPTTLPRASLPGKVASSASWDSLGTSVASSHSKGSSIASNNKDINKRRRRVRSDPRLDAGVLHRLAFTVWHTALHIEKEVCVLIIYK